MQGPERSGSLPWESVTDCNPRSFRDVRLQSHQIGNLRSASNQSMQVR
jgi:hypothetical protein